MGTKNNPGKFDCYANAHPDEPMFILLGRDANAPLLVDLWADFRSHGQKKPEKVQDARDCANAMREWRKLTNAAPEPVAIDGTSPGAILAELNHLRKLYTAAVVLIGHTRKETRRAEEMAPREAAEQLGYLGLAMQRAYEEHLSGQYEEALKRLAPEPDDTEEAK